jgi:UDP-glucuronate decarboxylase
MIEGLIRLMNTPDEITGPINLGNPKETSILELAQKIIELTGSNSKIVFKPLPQDDPRRRCPDITKAKIILNWEPKISLKEGLKTTIEYFKLKLGV